MRPGWRRLAKRQEIRMKRSNGSDESEDDEDTFEAHLMRAAADMMQLSALCRRARCFRARACRGMPGDCIARYAPAVPDEARNWVAVALSGAYDKYQLVYVMGKFPEAYAAFVQWVAVADGLRGAPPGDHGQAAGTGSHSQGRRSHAVDAARRERSRSGPAAKATSGGEKRWMRR
jgi:hypothetical protein